MKKIKFTLVIIVIISLSAGFVNAQKNITSNPITSSDLESHVSFLASPLLKGRLNGDEGLEIAGNYIASQAKKIGLIPGNNSSYFQSYKVIKKTTDYSKSSVKIVLNGKDTLLSDYPFMNLVPTGPDNFSADVS